MTTTSNAILAVMEDAMHSRAFDNLQLISIDHSLAVLTMKGQSAKQHLAHRWPIITVRAAGQGFFSRAVIDAHIRGQLYQLYEDANDVAGLSDSLINGPEAEVHALR